jgi:hypothetical protein
MKTCPSCGTHVLDDHRVCVRCGASVESPEPPEPAVTPPPSDRVRDNLHYLRELVPRRERMNELLPHPTGWMLGIGVPVIVFLAMLHGLFVPGSMQPAKKKAPTKAAQQTEFKRCLAQARASTERECSTLGDSEPVRRFSCQVSRSAMEYGQCVGQVAGRVGRCLGRCGQSARACSASCSGPTGQAWSETARCLVPCWKGQLDDCVRTCF